MKFRRTLLALATAATALAALPGTALAQGNYKSEYKMSLVVGTAFPWGKGGEIWAEKVRQATNGTSTSSSTRACPWSRATRRASSPRFARA